MKYLLYLDAVLAAFGAVMAVVLGVVCLIFGVYRGAAPAIGRDFPSLVMVTIAFAALMLVAGVATVGVWRRRRWLWLAQGGLVAAIPAIAAAVWTGVGAR